MQKTTKLNISIILELELLERLDVVANEKEWSRSHVVRHFLERALPQLPKNLFDQIPSPSPEKIG